MAAPKKNDDNSTERGAPGVGVDAQGGGVIDPTKNVLDLVKAESRYQDGMRDALEKNFNLAMGAGKAQIEALEKFIGRYQDAQRESETRRIDQLAQTRQEFQNTIRDMLAESVRTTSTLVSTQLVQIQATFDTRVSKLEAGAFTQAGKSSVSDPALADSLNQMARAISALKDSSTASSGRTTGRSDVVAWVVAGIMGAAAILGPIITIALRFR